jgi:hypothetical protein
MILGVGAQRALNNSINEGGFGEDPLACEPNERTKKIQTAAVHIFLRSLQIT